MSKDAFLKLFDAKVNHVFSHYYRQTLDREKAKNFTYVFFARAWKQAASDGCAEIEDTLRVLLQA